MAAANKLFISYPHKPEQCVQHVVMALKDRLVANGFDVWLDERIKTGHDWRQEITKGLQESEWVLVFLNSHSTRKDSICLDEIAMAARYKRGQIVSVLLESEEAIKTPLVLGRIQFVKMEEWEKKYKENKGGNAWNVWLQKQADELIAAFERREDLSQRGELDLLHEVLQPDQYWDEIANRLDGFVGREWIVEDIARKLKDPYGPRMLWLNGGPGIGKTSIAARLAHDLELPAAGVYFCRFDRSQTHSAHNVIRTLAYQMACTVPAYRQMLVRQLHLGIDSNSEKIHSLKDELNKLTVYQLFKKLLVDPTYIGGEPHLLIIDGLDEITTDGGDNEIAKLLAGQEFKSMQKWLRVLITSRPDALLKEILSSVESTTINAQSTENLADLHEYLEQQTCLGEGEVRQKVIDVMIDRSEGVFEYICKAVDAVKIGAFSVKKPEDFPVGLKAIYRAYIERSYPNCKQFENQARPLLELMIASPEPLPVEIAMAILKTDNYYFTNFVATMGSLVDLELWKRERKFAFFHRTFADWLANAVAPYNVSASAGIQGLAIELWKNLLNDGVFAKDGFVAEVLPNVLSRLTDNQKSAVIGEPSNSVIDCIEIASQDLAEIFKLNQASNFRKIHISEVELLKGSEHIDLANAYEKMASLLLIKGDYTDAEQFLNKALKIKEKTFGENHAEIAAICNDIGRILILKGCYSEAEVFFKKSLEIREEILGDDHTDTATTLSNLAGLLVIIGADNDQLSQIYYKVLTIKEKTLGEEHSETATALNNLAVHLMSKKDVSSAEKFLRKALAIGEKNHGPDHPNTATFLVNLGALLCDKGDFNESESLMRRALEICEKNLGFEHPKTAGIIRSLADFLELKGDYPEAELLYLRSISIKEKLLGPKHRNVAIALNNLAVMYLKNRKYDASIKCFVRALDIYENTESLSQNDIIAIKQNIAELNELNKKNKYMKIVKSYSKLASLVIGGSCFIIMMFLLAIAYIPDFLPRAYENFRRTGLITIVPTIVSIGLIPSIGWLWWEYRAASATDEDLDN